MRDPSRIGYMILLLTRYWRQQPDIRLGQLMTNICHSIAKEHPSVSEDAYYVEDDTMTRWLEKELRLYEK